MQFDIQSFRKKFNLPDEAQPRVSDVALAKLFASKRVIYARKDRVIYARKAGDEYGLQVENGEKITLDEACKLKHLAWGSASMPPKAEWLKQGITLHTAEQLFGYGVKTSKNGTRNFMMCLQAFFLKHLLFEKKGTGRGASQKSQLLKPNEKAQTDFVVGGIAEILIRIAEGKEAVFCIPGSDNCFDPTVQYGIDGVTEKLRLFKSKKEDEIAKVIRRYVSSLLQEQGIGLLCVLYSIILSRNFVRLAEDLQDQSENSLIDPMGDCTQSLLNLILLGKATPYLHNGSMYIEDEDTRESVERVGVVSRNDIGFLLWDRDIEQTDKWQLGSRLKTPTLPMWVTLVNGQYGVLFNPNKELMRSHHAENRFQLYYFADAEMKKDERRDTVLTIDTRGKSSHEKAMTKVQDDGDLEDGLQEPPLQLAIKNKWDGADIDWHGITPYVA